MPINRRSYDLNATLDAAWLDAIANVASKANAAVRAYAPKAQVVYQAVRQTEAGKILESAGRSFEQSAFGQAVKGSVKQLTAPVASVVSVTQPVVAKMAKATQVAQAVGVKINLPFDKDIASLQVQLKSVKSLELQAQAYRQQALAPLRRNADPTAQAAASRMEKAIDDAVGACEEAKFILNSAVNQAQALKSQAMALKLSSADVDRWSGLKANATGAAADARNRVGQLKDLVAQSVKLTTYAPTVGNVGQAFAQTFSEAGSRAAQAAESVGEGVMGTAGLMSYLPWLLVGGAVLYIGVKAVSGRRTA